MFNDYSNDPLQVKKLTDITFASRYQLKQVIIEWFKLLESKPVAAAVPTLMHNFTGINPLVSTGLINLLRFLSWH